MTEHKRTASNTLKSIIYKVFKFIFFSLYDLFKFHSNKHMDLALREGLNVNPSSPRTPREGLKVNSSSPRTPREGL